MGAALAIVIGFMILAAGFLAGKFPFVSLMAVDEVKWALPQKSLLPQK